MGPPPPSAPPAPGGILQPSWRRLRAWAVGSDCTGTRGSLDGHFREDSTMAQEGAEAPWGSLRGLAQELGRGRCSTFPWAPSDGTLSPGSGHPPSADGRVPPLKRPNTAAPQLPTRTENRRESG